MRTTILFFPCFILSLLFANTVHAQQEEVTFEIDEQIQRIYGTQDYLRDKGIVCTGSGTEFPIREDIKEIIKEIEGRVAEVQKEIKIEPLTVGLVFHFLNTKDSEQANRQIKDQLDALNRDFNNKAWNAKHPNDPDGKYLKLAASADITFELAQIENQEFGQGIQTLTITEKEWETWDDMKLPDKGGSPAIDPSNHINIWVADLPVHLSSYATSPYFIDEMDGIVIDSKYFGTVEDGVYKEGKTLTHLIGNYMGLHDLWNESEPCTDDYVADTPIHNARNDGAYEHEHISACPGYPAEMVMNYMDSSPDELVNMFTSGQVLRIHAVMYTVRESLFSNSKKKGL